MNVELEDGRTIVADFEKYPRLAKATEAQRANCEIIGRGVGIHWPELDEDLSTEGLLRDAIAVRAAKPDQPNAGA